MKRFKFLILILVAIFNSLNCEVSRKEVDSKCCVNTTNQRVVVEFSSNVVQHEYIVQFKNYYQTEAREKFLRAALETSNVSNLIIFIDH